MKALPNAMKPREEGFILSYIKPNETRTPLNNCLSLYVSYNYPPLVPRWLLIVIDINLFWIVLLLDPQGCYSIPVVIEGLPPSP
jgi:hypothetical protein